MSYKLYRFAPFDRSAKVAWCLEELGIPFEAVEVDGKNKEHKSKEYMDAIHPMGAVPALVDGSLKMIESSAICMYLADKHIEKGLAPALDAPERAEYTKWIGFLMSTVDPLSAARMHVREIHAAHPTEATKAQLDKINEEFALATKTLDSALGSNQYLVGNRFSAADMVLASFSRFREHYGELEGYTNLKRHLKAMWERPANKKVAAFEIPATFGK